MIFHGAFKSKADAKRKERQVHGFIQPRNIKGERRYVVMSQRKNPIRRRKRNLFSELQGSMLDPQTGRWAAWKRTKRMGTVRAEGETKREAQRELKERIRQHKQAARSGNPMELTVMGANPRRMPEMVKSYAPRYPHDHNPQHEEIIVHPGQTITFKFNPSAEAIREDFTGRPVDFISISREPHMEKGEYAKLGDLMGITYKPIGGGQVEGIGWYQGAETIPLHEAAKKLLKLTDAPVLVASRDKHLYLAGGNQDYSPMLAHLKVNPDGDDCWELGEARTIVYRERKHFDDFALVNYEHKFGEENGERPVIVYDRRNNRLLLKGGDYDIRPEGIVD
jgi:hypothetical protein